MDPFERLRQNGADSEECGAFGRPVARRSGAVLLAGDDQERNALGRIAHRRVIEELLLAVGQVQRVGAFLALHERVAQSDVAERAAHHDLVVAAPSAVRVELERPDAVRLQPGAGRRPRCDRSGRRDVVGRHRVAEHGQDARTLDVAQVGRFAPTNPTPLSVVITPVRNGGRAIYVESTSQT